MIIFSLFISSLILNLILYFNYRKIANLYNIFDVPGKKNIHKSNTPLLGGLFILLNFFLLIIYYCLFFDNQIFEAKFFGEKNEVTDSRSNKIFFVFFLIPIIFFFIGYLDDKFNLKHNIKFFIFIFFMLLSLLIDESIILMNLNFEFLDKNIILNDISLFFTLFCMLVLVNAINMFDGINLQSGIFYTYVFSVLIYFNSFEVLSLFFIFQIIFFIFLNFKGKIFIGNSGNLFLSFIVSIMIIKSYNAQNFANAEIVLLLLLYPGLDLIRLFFTRILNGKHPFSKDLNHIHHLLLKRNNYLKVNLVIFFSYIIPMFSYIYFKNFYLSFILMIILYLISIKKD